LISVFRGVKLEEKTVRCNVWKHKSEVDGRLWAHCTFENVTFNQDTKLNIEPSFYSRDSDRTVEDVNVVSFESSSVSLVHPDVLEKFPNIEDIRLGLEDDSSELQNPDHIENCQNIISIYAKFTGISSETFSDCKKLEKLWIASDSVTDLPEGYFKNQENLKTLELRGQNLKLRVSAFEGLKSLSELTLYSMDLSQVEDNFFHSLRIKKLSYDGKDDKTFPIETLNSQETIEELELQRTDLSQFAESFRSMKKLKKIDLPNNLIRSVETFVDLPNIERIVLGRNEIEELPANAFKGCPQLSALHLYGNTIATLRGDQFSQLSGLKKLSLSPRKSASIAPTTLHQLRSLEWLELTFEENDNTISKELFMYSTNLKTLILSWNNIRAIHPEAFDNLRNLTSLNLRDNTCVDELFEAPAGETVDLTSVKQKLKTCFENFAKQEGL
jgi:Leucine-rich repeat (LRR) protein